MKKTLFLLAMCAVLGTTQAAPTSTSTSTGTGTATSTSGSVTVSGGTSDSSNANNAKQTISLGGSSTSYEPQKRDPVTTAYSNLAAPSAPCMGSSSVGAQGVGFGLSVGSTWTSEDCNNREDIRAAHNYGNKAVAEEMLRMNVKSYAEAENRIADRKSGKVSGANPAKVSSSNNKALDDYLNAGGTDKTVIARLK